MTESSESSEKKELIPLDNPEEISTIISIPACLYSHLFFPLFLLLFFIFLTVGLYIDHAGPFTSSSFEQPFSDSMNPMFYVHLSDLHFSYDLPETATRNEEMFTYIDTVLNPPVVIITGDNIEGTDVDKTLPHYRQRLSDWELFNETKTKTNLIKNRLMVESCGNHDLMVTLEDTPDHNFCRKFIMKEGDAFTAKGFDYDEPTQPKQLRFIRYNPLHPPVATGLGGMMPQLTKANTEPLEDEIDPSRINIVGVHFPVNLYWGSTSALLKAHAVLTGHTHPLELEITRYSNTVNPITPAGVSRVFNVGTVDNGQLAFNPLTEEDTLAITYPIPYNQLTSNSVFNSKTFPIRVLQFKEQTPVKYSIDEAPYEELNFLREIRTGVYLHTLSVTATSGKHTLEVKDATSSRKIEFFIGDTAPKERQQATNMYYVPGAAFLEAAYAVTTIYLILKFVPFHLFTHNDYEDWLIGKRPFSKWDLLYGPLYFLGRTYKLPIHLFVIFAVLIVIYLVCPIYLSKMEEGVAAMFLWGVAAKGKVVPEITLFLIVMAYQLVFVLPLFSLTSLWYEFRKFGKIQWVEFVVQWVGVAAFMALWCVGGQVLGQTLGIVGSPITYVSLACVVTVIVTFARGNTKKVTGIEIP